MYLDYHMIGFNKFLVNNEYAFGNMCYLLSFEHSGLTFFTEKTRLVNQQMDMTKVQKSPSKFQNHASSDK